MVIYSKSDLQAARQLFRDKQPIEALVEARDALRNNPDNADIAQFIQAVLANLNALMKRAQREADHAEVIRLGRWVMFAPAFSATAPAIVLSAMRETLSPAERGVVLREWSGSGPLPDVLWEEAGAVLAELPTDPTQVAAGFEILHHVPGNATALIALAGHLGALGRPSRPDDSQVAGLLQQLQGRWPGLENTPPDVVDRKTGYDTIRVELGTADLRHRMARSNFVAASDDLITLALSVEHAVARMEGLFQPIMDATVPAEDVWALADPNSVHYVMRNPAPLSPAAQQLLAAPHPGQWRNRHFARVRVILSLWLRAINFEASQDRIGYLWLVLDPLIHVLIICIVPFLLHADQVSDMNTFPFAIIGACFWMTFRTAAMGALAGGGVLKSQLEHPAVRRFDIIVARGLSAIVVYFFVGLFLLFVTTFMGLSGFPVNLPLFLVCFMTMWILGMAYGIILHSLVLRYPGVRRINGFLIRAIAFTSGLFYVTEQLPDDVARLILWNPLVHVNQLARSYWFYDYNTRDGDPIYVIWWLLAMVVLALSCNVVDEHRPESVRA